MQVACRYLVFLPFFLLAAILGKGRAGAGGSCPQAAGGLTEVAADGVRERTVHNIAMIRQGRMRSMNHHHHHQHSCPRLKGASSPAVPTQVFLGLGPTSRCVWYWTSIALAIPLVAADHYLLGTVRFGVTGDEPRRHSTEPALIRSPRMFSAVRGGKGGGTSGIGGAVGGEERLV